MKRVSWARWVVDDRMEHEILFDSTPTPPKSITVAFTSESGEVTKEAMQDIRVEGHTVRGWTSIASEE